MASPGPPQSFVTQLWFPMTVGIQGLWEKGGGGRLGRGALDRTANDLPPRAEQTHLSGDRRYGCPGLWGIGSPVKCVTKVQSSLLET
jgi:hypothetical protein